MESPYQMRYFSVRITQDGAVTGVNLTHIAAIDRSRAIRWAKTVQQLWRPEGLLPSGRLVYAYSRRPAEGGSTLVVFLDCTGEVRASRQLLRHSIVFGVLTLALFWAVWRRAYPGDMGYGLIYFYVSVAPTWLLSGPRYLTALYAVYPALAVLLRKKAAFALLAIAFGLLCLVSGGMFAGYGCIL